MAFFKGYNIYAFFFLLVYSFTEVTLNCKVLLLKFFLLNVHFWVTFTFLPFVPFYQLLKLYLFSFLGFTAFLFLHPV